MKIGALILLGIIFISIIIGISLCINVHNNAKKKTPEKIPQKPESDPEPEPESEPEKRYEPKRYNITYKENLNEIMNLMDVYLDSDVNDNTWESEVRKEEFEHELEDLEDYFRYEKRSFIVKNFTRFTDDDIAEKISNGFSVLFKEKTAIGCLGNSIYSVTFKLKRKDAERRMDELHFLIAKEKAEIEEQIKKNKKKKAALKRRLSLNNYI